MYSLDRVIRKSTGQTGTIFGFISGCVAEVILDGTQHKIVQIHIDDLKIISNPF